jgi:serine/threonine protein kinase
MASLASLASKSSGPEMSMPPSASRVTPVPNVPLDNGGNNNWDTAAHRTAPFVPPPQRDWTNMTRTIAHYERIEQIGEGTYGQVYRARCKDTNQIVALKKIRVHHGGYWGMPPTVIREIKILKRLRHPNLVKMVEVVSSKGVEHLDEDDEVEEKHKLSKKDRIIDAREGYKGNLFLVLEYVSHDLTGLMDVAYRFTEVQVKCIFKQLLEALEYMHENKYIHRDIKSSNILIDHNFRVKLADFGLARSIEPPILDKIHEYVTYFVRTFFVVYFVLLSFISRNYLSFSVFVSLPAPKSGEHAGVHQQGDHALVPSAGDFVGGNQIWNSGGCLECRLYFGRAHFGEATVHGKDGNGSTAAHL